MYAFPVGRNVVTYVDNSSDEEDLKRNKRKSKKCKKGKKTEVRCGALLVPSGPMPMRYPQGATPIYVSPPPPRPIFAAHVQVNAQPVVPCPMIAVTHTQLYPPPAGPGFGRPSTTYLLQAVNPAPSAVAVPAFPASGPYSTLLSPSQMIPIYHG